jgi:hypothetical protein
MDSFASLFTIASNAPEKAEPTTSARADNGSGHGGCIIV